MPHEKLSFAALAQYAMNIPRFEFEVPSIPRAFTDIKSISVQEADSFQDGIKEVFEELQANLAESEELVVYHSNGVDVIRVKDIYMSSTNVAVISGWDSSGNTTRVVSHFKALSFTCKVVKLDEQKSRIAIGFSTS
jgi:hypothetical protein